MNIVQMLISPNRYGVKCPYIMTATRIVVHNTANDASARNEISYMINNNSEVSFHFAVDDKEVVQGIPLDRNTWNAGDGNGAGNRQGISIEICYSLSGGDKFLKAEQNAAKLIAQLLKERGWGIDKVTKHQDYNGKYCPHRTLDMGWNRFLDMIRKELGQTPSSQPKPQPQSQPSSKPNIIYGVKTLNHGILPDVTNREDFAGYGNDAIVGVKIGVTSGSVEYRVHLVNKGWLPKVTGSNWNDHNNGYAGDGKTSIDAIQIYYHTDTSKTGGKYYSAIYQVKPYNNKKYYPNVKDTNWENIDGNNTAGCFGTPFTELKISLE